MSRKSKPENTELAEVNELAETTETQETPDQALEEVQVEAFPEPVPSSVAAPIPEPVYQSHADPAVVPTGPRIYLGPNLPGGRLLQSTVFQGDVPKYLLPVLEENKDVAALIVPVSEMSLIQGRIIKSGTPEYAAYQRILKGDTSNGN